MGASYAGDSGTVVLQSEVRLSGLRNEKPLVVTASRAELDRVPEEADGAGQSNLVKLEGAHLTQESDAGAETGLCGPGAGAGRGRMERRNAWRLRATSC